MRCKLGVALTLCLLLSTISFAASKLPSVEDLTQTYHQAFEEGATKFSKQTNQVSLFDRSPSNTSSNDDTSDNNKAKNTTEPCDCYSDNAYNYPSNFLYSTDHVRLKRINPACTCKPHAAPKTKPKQTPQPSYTAFPSDNSSNTQNTNSLPPSANEAQSSPQTNGSGINPGFGASPNSNSSQSSSTDNANSDNFGISYN